VGLLGKRDAVWGGSLPQKKFTWYGMFGELNK